MNKITIEPINRALKKIFLILLSISAGCGQACPQAGPPETYRNPILPGFHPDPSICRVEGDYYLVNSSFEWYPGLPVFHSRDLVNWELIGYGIHRPGQVELPAGLADSRGLYAPSIRYHEGIFYLINTCVNCRNNFYITATDPTGPWSDPVWLSSPGIDPDLFWDDDGKCYYLGHSNLSGVEDWPNKNGAWIQELDLEMQELTGERTQLTHGHASNARWTEGPHLYRIGDTYMLLVAEGGTGFHHAVTVFYSDDIRGPYIPEHANPVLTHRHLGKDYPVHSVGHADLVQTQNGEWWSVMLGKRLIDGKTLLSRETFLTPVRFEAHDGILTPVFNPGVGKLLSEQQRPDLPWTPVPHPPEKDEFDTPELALQWNFLRTPQDEWYRTGDGKLTMEVRPEVADSFVNPSLIARRIEHHDFSAATSVRFRTGKENEQGGLILYRRSTHHFQLLKDRDGIVLYKTLDGKKEEIARVHFREANAILAVEAEGLNARFFYGAPSGKLLPIGPAQDMSLLSDEVCGGFNGPFVGMYATGNGKPSKSTIEFDWFEYKSKQ